ncbi:hypothetical protein K435DRAFT_915494 [Dendrothele bispora CBS 962.96]|uniref:Uncharacterized protein n=1 Tax=Dendrothele bispora (strain CBS 962.96) TaxID=1314807 RepID=A0A4S8LJA0_DENBC|nr:hypothetical protein K435DRAFT_915494 [Dendrothele bispora CBS 962.96]
MNQQPNETPNPSWNLPSDSTVAPNSTSTTSVPWNAWNASMMSNSPNMIGLGNLMNASNASNTPNTTDQFNLGNHSNMSGMNIPNSGNMTAQTNANDSNASNLPHAFSMPNANVSNVSNMSNTSNVSNQGMMAGHVPMFTNIPVNAEKNQQASPQVGNVSPLSPTNINTETGPVAPNITPVTGNAMLNIYSSPTSMPALGYMPGNNIGGGFMNGSFNMPMAFTNDPQSPTQTFVTPNQNGAPFMPPMSGGVFPGSETWFMQAMNQTAHAAAQEAAKQTRANLEAEQEATKGSKQKKPTTTQMDRNDIWDAFNMYCGYTKYDPLPHYPGHREYAPRFATPEGDRYLDAYWNRGPKSPENKALYREIIKHLREDDQKEQESKKKFSKLTDKDLIEAFAKYFTTRRVTYWSQNDEKAEKSNDKHHRTTRRSGRKRTKVLSRRRSVQKYQDKHGKELTQGADKLVLTDCQSSEYSGTDTPKQNIKILNLPWRSQKLTSFYYELDALANIPSQGPSSQSRKVVEGAPRKTRRRDDRGRTCRNPVPVLGKKPPRVCVDPRFVDKENVIPNDPSWTIVAFLDRYAPGEGYEAGDEEEEAGDGKDDTPGDVADVGHGTGSIISPGVNQVVQCITNVNTSGVNVLRIQDGDMSTVPENQDTSVGQAGPKVATGNEGHVGNDKDIGMGTNGAMNN